MNKEYSEVIKRAGKEGFALGAFNVFNHLTAKAVVAAAEELNLPVILEMSASVAKKLGSLHAINLLNQVKEEAKVPVIIHLDHCTDLDFALECVDNNWKSIMFDGSNLTLEENIKQCKKLVEYAKGRDIHIEGEVGVIQGMEDGVFSEASKLADFDETAYFIRETGVDTIAPAIGTAHGLYKGVPHINYELIKRITDELNTPVVIHGGTGLEKEAYKKLVECGAVKINVSTAIKYGYMNGMKEAIDAEGAIEAPLKADDVIFESVKKVAKEHISLFSAK